MDAADLWRAAGDRLGSTDFSRASADQLVSAAVPLVAELPAEVHRRVHEYRVRSAHSDVLLLRGLLPSVEFGPNPMASGAPLDTEQAQRGAMILLAVALLLGEPFNFRSLYDGQVVQHVVPVPRMENTQTSESSSGTLDWHVEDGFSPDRCDYFGLLCLRGAENAVTRYAAARDLRLPAEVRRVLAEPRFEMHADSAHVSPSVTKSVTPVLFGPDHALEICYDDHYLRPVDGDDEAKEALAELKEALDEAKAGHVLEPGDLIMLDNRRVVHARTPFRAAYDGHDRWLLRTMVCSSIARLHRHGSRII
ncbi:TauD/TfdA family dioxygenase [Actinophytocola xanthii]|uniref:TauD/TfdA-like domain-containing protein n=1 Tax=Actinophytocola xanthii TaxID=1912961 RepID=A0A1Q8CK04_9PSEU|nr:TauD/TfdA family dioxygenase [Actinophytocola xanthii]OLF14695.1 hypothetical protein BU204_25735 [Actinophytocola xanthii]